MATRRVIVEMDGERRDYRLGNAISLHAIRMELQNKFGESDTPTEGACKVAISCADKPQPLSSRSEPRVDAVAPLYVSASAADVTKEVDAIVRRLAPV